MIFPDVEVEDASGEGERKIQPGDYVCVDITDYSPLILKGNPLTITTLQGCSLTGVEKMTESQAV